MFYATRRYKHGETKGAKELLTTKYAEKEDLLATECTDHTKKEILTNMLRVLFSEENKIHSKVFMLIPGIGETLFRM